MAILLQGNAFVSAGSGGGGGGGGLAIANCKGHVHTFGGQSNGFYELSPQIPDAQDSKALVLGIPLNLTEITQPTTTLDDKRVLYLFGSAWNDLSVSGVLLLGESSTRGEQLTKLIQWYNENRVSKKRGPVSLSLGTTGIDAYVTGLRLDQANSQTNTQNFSIQMVTTDVEA